MPKETVSQRYTTLAPDDAESSMETVEVGWDKDGEHVTIRHGLTFRRWDDEAARLVVDQRPEAFSTSIDLTHRQLNDLIRALRKARDGAFGADA